MKSVWRRQCWVKYETEIFGRQAGHYGYCGREGERGVDYFRGLLREIDKKEFSFRGIESKIVEDIQDEMRVIVDWRLFMADETFLGTKDMKSCMSSAHRRWDRRITDERAKRSGINIEKNWAENVALWNSAGKRGWRGTVWRDPYSRCAGWEIWSELLWWNRGNAKQVEDDGVGWSGREYQRQLIDQEDKGRRLVEWRWH